MNIFHPEPQNRHLFHFNFGNVACDSRKKSEGENHIKVAAVIAHIENRSIGRNIFLSPDNQVDPCQSQMCIRDSYLMGCNLESVDFYGEAEQKTGYLLLLAQLAGKNSSFKEK